MDSVFSCLLVLAGVIGLIILKFKILKAFIKITLKVFFILLIAGGALYLLNILLSVF